MQFQPVPAVAQGPRRVRGNLILAKRQVQYANRIEPDEAGLLLVEEWLTL